MNSLQDFEETWAVDFEYGLDVIGMPDVRCVVAQEVGSGRVVKAWRDELGSTPPFATGSRSLVLAYYAPAEVACFEALGWHRPENLVDVYAEYRAFRNGLAARTERFGLVDALTHFGITSLTQEEKDENRRLALRGGTYSRSERARLLDYCASDVFGLTALWSSLRNHVDTSRARLRGRYACDVALIEQVGLPLDAALLGRFYAKRTAIRERAIEQLDELKVYRDGVFSRSSFDDYVRSKYPEWPRTRTGRHRIDDDTLRSYASRDSRLSRLQLLRRTLTRLQAAELQVDIDGRCRPSLSMFGTRTGRNAPRITSFIPAHPKFMRAFIRPESGNAIAYLDWSAQELGIAATLSRDDKLWDVYCAPDPYLRMGFLLGDIPENATKQTHPRERDEYKIVALAILYQMGFQTLARQTGISLAEAAWRLQKHRTMFPAFWAWNDRVESAALLQCQLQTVFGWRLNVPRGCEARNDKRRDQRPTTVRTIRNFPMQANGAEMMRLACSFGHDSGVRICAPVHDGFFIEATESELESTIAVMREAMDRASRAVLGGRVLKTSVEARVYHDRRYPLEGEDRHLWEAIVDCLEDE